MEMLDPETAQRPMDVIVLLSYPVSLSAAAAGSVWTWLAVAVAGVWVWRLLSHQSARRGVALTAASHLLPPETETTSARMLQKQRTRMADLPWSPSAMQDDDDNNRLEDQIEAACCRAVDCPGPLPAPAIEEASCRKAATVYFEGHGGRCRGSSSEDDDEEDQAVSASCGRRRRRDVAGGAILGCWPLGDGCSPGKKVVLCWEDAQGEENTLVESVMAMVTNRMRDFGYHGFQDRGRINGNVVRLWDAPAGRGCRVPNSP